MKFSIKAFLSKCEDQRPKKKKKKILNGKLHLLCSLAINCKLFSLKSSMKDACYSPNTSLECRGLGHLIELVYFINKLVTIFRVLLNIRS